MSCPCNIYCPPVMSDRRIFTSYVPNSTVNEYIRYSNNIENSTVFRQFLQHNTPKFMKQDDLKTGCSVNCHNLKNRKPYYYEKLYDGKKSSYIKDITFL